MPLKPLVAIALQPSIRQSYYTQKTLYTENKQASKHINKPTDHRIPRYACALRYYRAKYNLPHICIVAGPLISTIPSILAASFEYYKFLRGQHDEVRDEVLGDEKLLIYFAWPNYCIVMGNSLHKNGAGFRAITP